jgi:hypothetical protein
VYEGPSKLSYRSEASIECCNNSAVVVDDASKIKTVDIASIINKYRINEYKGSPLTIFST